MKTVAIKIEDDMHAQLTLIAQLEGTTLTDVIRRAVEQSVTTMLTGDGLANRAKQLLEEIDHESKARKQAVQDLIGQVGAKTTSTTKRSRRSGAAEQSSS